MLLVVEPYRFGHMVKGNFQISKFPSKFGFAYGIALQIRVLHVHQLLFFQIYVCGF